MTISKDLKTVIVEKDYLSNLFLRWTNHKTDADSAMSELHFNYRIAEELHLSELAKACTESAGGPNGMEA